MAPSVQCHKVSLMRTTRVPCSNAAKMRNPLKFAGVPQTCQQISAISRLKFTILSGHVEEVLLFNNFFPIVDTCLSSEDIARQSCKMVPKCQFFASCISSKPRAARRVHSRDGHGPCTQPCRVLGHVHGRVHCPYTAMYTARVLGRGRVHVDTARTRRWTRRVYTAVYETYRIFNLQNL